MRLPQELCGSSATSSATNSYAADISKDLNFCYDPSSKSINRHVHGNLLHHTLKKAVLEPGTICLVFVTKSRFYQGVVEVAHWHADMVHAEGQELIRISKA